MALKAVGFDIDGTLYPDFRARWRSLPFLLAHFRTILAFSRTRHLMRENHSAREFDGDIGDLEVEYFAGERGCSLEEARDIRDRILYKGWEAYFRGMIIYPDVRESLEKLKDAGLKLAVLSDFPVGRKLEYFGLEGIFDVILGFPDSGRLKPRPEPFMAMAEGLETDPKEILYIGNRLDYDVRGAENIGMRGALIGPPGRKAPSDVTKFSDYRHMAGSILSEVVK
ncbi:MAG: HAD family hydrolase [Spirochaetes bacterium]|nr:MAG: HAD family hydrolase [Spirochaetota bacterium]RKX89960.1 MAG: HAD family hydrolase [Spirochaetota bacterium]RKX98571.1 MAG: HAD family hydrolase [Spirochaetota bacterium]